MESAVKTPETNQIKRSEAEVEKMIALMNSNTLEGRTAKLLDINSTDAYIEDIRQMMGIYVASKDFNEMFEFAKMDFIYRTTALIEFIAKLDQK